MCTARKRELIFQNAHCAHARAQFCRPKMVRMTSQISKMSTALWWEHHSQSKGAPHASERPKNALTERRKRSRCGGAHITSLSVDPLDVRNAWVAGRSEMGSTCIWNRQGMGLAQWSMAAHGGAFWACGNGGDCFAQVRTRCIWTRQGIGLNTIGFEQA